MCCNSFSLSAPANESKPDHVSETLVAAPLPDGYWIQAFPYKAGDLPDLVASGLGFEGKPASVNLFVNPANSGSKGWKVNEIASLDFPVAMTYADLTGNGFNDLILCDHYGPSMDDLWDAKTQDGGRVIWLQNPGDRNAQPFWRSHKIGNSTGMHRLEAGHFTTNKHTEVMGFPVIAKSGDRTSPAPILLYTPVYGEDPSQGPQSWTEEIPFPSEFRLIHDVKLLPKTNGELDMILVAGREGTVLLWYSVEEKSWKHNVVGTGLPETPGNPYWGSGSVDVGRVGDDDFAYVGTCEGFHGNVVAVYLKNPGTPKGPEPLKDSTHWRRVVIDDFGPLNSGHTGTIHNVKTIQIGGPDAPQSLAVACMGVPVGEARNQGVHLYTPGDLSRGEFKHTKATNESAARVAIAGFSDPKALDMASISYYVPGYHTGPDPPSVRINTFGTHGLDIVADRLNKEILLRIPRPDIIPAGESRILPFWILAGKKITIVVLPPGGKYDFNSRDAAKVIYGTISLVLEGTKVTRGIAPPKKDKGTTLVFGTATAGDKGAVFIHLEVLDDHMQGPFSIMSEVSSLNILPNNPHVSSGARAVQLPFIKVQDLDWANSGLWDKFEFYNVTGFHVFFNDDSFENVVHMQAWTLGLGETARFHNHYDKSFCEIHYCLSNGGGQGGMRYFPDDYTDPIDVEAELTLEYVEKNSELLVVPDMYEHGPLWKVQEGHQAQPEFRPTNGTVDYPWHAWLSSRFGQWPLPMPQPLPPNEQKYDVWMAFEFPPTAFQY